MRNPQLPQSCTKPPRREEGSSVHSFQFSVPSFSILWCSTWNISLAPRDACGKRPGKPSATRFVSIECWTAHGAPKYVIAIVHRLALFSKHLSVLHNLNGTRHRGSQPEGRRGQDYDRH